MTNIVVDVAIVGAGLSGLTAASTLLREDAKLKVAVIEARDRVGGRTYSTTTTALGLNEQATIELGGMWIAPADQQPNVRRLLDRLRLNLHPQYHQGKKIIDLNGKVSTYASDIPWGVSIASLIDVQLALLQVESIRHAVSCESPQSSPYARYFDSLTCEALVKQSFLTEDGLKLFEIAIRAVFGVEPSELSVLHFLHYVQTAGGFENLIKIINAFQESTIVGGSQQISLRLSEELKQFKGFQLLLSSPVRAIDQLSSKSARIECSSTGKDVKVIEAQYVILAMPPCMVNRIDFSPNLPIHRQELNRRSFMGSAIKSFVIYDRAFWREKGFSGEVIADYENPDRPVFNVFDHCIPLASTATEEKLLPALVCFINGEPAREWAQRSKDDRQTAVINQLARWFGEEAHHYKAYVEQNWVTDEWTRGAPITVFPPGVLSRAGHALRRPVGRIHWAGTETATQGQGFLDGAVQAGERAASEVLESLREPKPPNLNPTIFFPRVPQNWRYPRCWCLARLPFLLFALIGFLLALVPLIMLYFNQNVIGNK